ncbi:EF hand domain-containing protein [Rhizophagus clarus]|uniref:EF hand domain-containing protein n=1 Tax=Rhizophagus clarus TaxID=94130 RepID=A0A8H3M2H4_9GLOM|nr:EF hand domain-containing protein [Rhizophagus clarus]
MELSRSPSLLKTKGPEITLTNEEKHAYSQLFQVADEENKGVISGQNAVKLFMKSHLPSPVLSNIWQIADSENKGYLTKQTFSVAIKLIAQVQNGKSPDPSNLNADLPIPRFEGIDIEPYKKPEQNNIIITNEDRERYKDMFYKLNPTNGFIDGDKAKDIFVRSKLNVEKLSQIWTLADTKERGKLDLPEFIIAMHFIQQTMRGLIKTLPSELPNGFYEMASGTEINTPASPPNFAKNLSSPRLGQSPVTRQMTLDSGTITPSIFQDNSWDVTDKEKASYDRFFDEESTNGYITGEGAANFFMKSKLPSDQLAQIWDLADINKSGKLSRDEFAVAMYLITKKLTGVPLPKSLPNSLIPPSMRSVGASPFTDLKRSATMGNKLSRPHTSQLSESDLFFDSLHHTVAASSSPFFSSTASQSGSEFDLLGDTDISTKIALESGEIKNYKLQSENLNNAIADLKTNRANVESNISSLVTQKQDMMTQLSQIRTLYESETKAMREIQAKYELEHESVEQARQELLQAENALKTLQSERDQLQANIQKDRDETLDIKRRMRIIEEETVSIKGEIEKHKKDEKQQKGFLAINRKQLAAVEGEKEKAFKTLQGLEEKNLSSDEINDPFGNGAFTPLTFNPSNTTQGPGISASQPNVDFNDFQRSPNHSHRGSLSSISGSRVKRSMSNASIASNSTLGTSSIKSVPLNTHKSDELSFDKPITVASSKPSEFENLLNEQLSSTPQEITANESNKTNPFDSTFNDPFGVAKDQTSKSTLNNEESKTQQDIVKESEKSEADPFANLNNIPTPVKSVSNNDDLSSDSFTKEFPSIEELEASMTNVSNSGFDNDFTSLTTNNEKKDDNLNVNNLMETTKNEKSENTLITAAEAVSDSETWVSIERSKSIAPQDEFDGLIEAKVTKTPPIDFDADIDTDFDDNADLTFGASTTFTKPSTSNNNTLTSFKTDNFVKSPLDFDKDENLFDDFDPFSPNAPSSNKPKANLDAAFGGISAEPSKTNVDDFGFEDAFSEFISTVPTDKKSTTNTSIKASTSSSIVGDDVDDVKRLMAMGYSREKVVRALEQNNYDFEKSLNFIVEDTS